MNASGMVTALPLEFSFVTDVPNLDSKFKNVSIMALYVVSNALKLVKGLLSSDNAPY